MVVLRRVVLVSTGFTINRPLESILKTGLGSGDVLIIVNSEPFRDKAVEVVNLLAEHVNRIYSGVLIIKKILDPGKFFEDNVRELRILVESYAPCKSYFLAVGGFRWLTIAFMITAYAVYTRRMINNVSVETLELLLEESPIVLKEYKTLEERTIKIPILTRIADVKIDELEILEAIAKGHYRTKQIKRYLEQKRRNYSTKTIAKKLQELIRKELVTWEKRGRSFIYKLTPIGKTIA